MSEIELSNTDMMTMFSIASSKPKSVGFKMLDVEKAFEFCKGHSHVELGLAEDWNATSDIVFFDGQFIDACFFATSNWATPVAVVDGVTHECWEHSDTPFDAEEKWQSMLAEKGIEPITCSQLIACLKEVL